MKLSLILTLPVPLLNLVRTDRLTNTQHHIYASFHHAQSSSCLTRAHYIYFSPQSYEQTKTAFGASIPVGKDMLGATMDVTDMFFGKMEELQTMNVAKDNSSTSTSDNDGSENSDVKNTS